MNEYHTLEIKYIGIFKSKSEPCYGEFGLWQPDEDMKPWNMLGCPRCGHWSWLKDHNVKIENDVVTISPSIGCPLCHAHYYVKNNKVEVLPDW